MIVFSLTNKKQREENMDEMVHVRISELAAICEVSKGAITTAMKKEENKENLYIKNSRIQGIKPLLVKSYMERKFDPIIFDSKLVLCAAQVGGCGKTSTVANLGYANARLGLSGGKSKTIMIDADSQASLSIGLTGSAADEEEYTLIDFVDKKCSAKDLITEIGTDMWLVKSNLNNLFLDKSFSNPKLVKNSMSLLVTELFELGGIGSKIFVDTGPQLSQLLSSFVCALGTIQESGVLLCPVRPDLYGYKGARICIEESLDVLTTFSITKPIAINCYVNSYASRTKTSVATLKRVMQDPILGKYSSSVAIRHSAEVAKSSYAANASVFQANAKACTTIGADYVELLLESLAKEPEVVDGH